MAALLRLRCGKAGLLQDGGLCRLCGGTLKSKLTKKGLKPDDLIDTGRKSNIFCFARSAASPFCCLLRQTIGVAPR